MVMRISFVLIDVSEDKILEEFVGVNVPRAKVADLFTMDLTLEIPVEILLVKKLFLVTFYVLILLREWLSWSQISLRNSISSLLSNELWQVKRRVSMKRNSTHILSSVKVKDLVSRLREVLM